MFSKPIYFLLLFTAFAACDAPRKTTVSNTTQKCKPDILEKEIAPLKVGSSCTEKVEKSGKVVLSFYLDESGIPRKIRNNFASANTQNNIECAVNNLRGFRSRTQKNCEADTTYSFKKKLAYENMLVELNEIVLDGHESKNVELFKRFFHNHARKMRIDAIIILVPFAKTLQKSPKERDSTFPAVMRMLEKLFFQLSKERFLEALKDSKIPNVPTTKLFADYVELIVYEFEQTRLEENDPVETTRTYFASLKNVQRVSMTFSNFPLPGNDPGWQIDYQLARASFELTKIARSNQSPWIKYSDLAAIRTRELKKHILRNISTRIAHASRGYGIKHTEEEMKRYREEETAKSAVLPSQVEDLETEITKHRLEGCPAREELKRQRWMLRDIALGTSTEVKNIGSYFADEEKMKKLETSRRKNTKNIAEKIDSALFQNSTRCWPRNWEIDFSRTETNWRRKLKSHIPKLELIECLEPEGGTAFSLIVDRDGRKSNIQLNLTWDTELDKKSKRCLRKKLNAMHFPKRSTGGSIRIFKRIWGPENLQKGRPRPRHRHRRVRK